MLQELVIRNFAIIDDLRISFSKGLTVFSGETGAGKSIIINAVNFLLGSRASTKLIRTGAAFAELEALFRIAPDSTVAKILTDNGFENTRELVVRRIISHRDRHKIFINGRISTIQFLTTLTEKLASISGQHEHQGLLKEEQQIQILDQFGGVTSQRENVSACFHRMMPLIRHLEDLNAQVVRQREHTAFLEFQKQDILQAAIIPEEDTELEVIRTRLKNSEMLYHTVHHAVEALYGAEGAVTERLSELKKELEKASRIDPVLSSSVQGISAMVFELEDTTAGLRNYLSNLNMDQGRLEAVEDRLNVLNGLKRKYGGSLEAVAMHLQSIEKELAHHDQLTDKVVESEAALSELFNRLETLALDLSEKRKKAAISLAEKVELELSTLKMSEAKFTISIQPFPAERTAVERLKINGGSIQETGIDRVVFYISPNVGEELKPLACIVSGGELSRIILALKVILAVTESTETLIFDEVDAGIGGAVAERIGQKLFSLSRYHQVICITHLPQIAKYADNHYRISKHVIHERTTTRIHPLGKKERIEEIARMLGGENITLATLAHAQEILNLKGSVPLS